jgi:transcriptional regulator with XRE-family HTH domain
MNPREATDIFQERLKHARDLRGLSQTQLATNAALPASSVSHFESGARKPSFDNLKRLAGALSVTTDYLLGRSDVRDQHKLSSEDLKLTEQFVDMLLKRGAQKKDDE